MKKILTLFAMLLLASSMAVVQAYVFSSGTKIYYNLMEYGGGINPYAPGSNNWEGSTAKIIEVTLNSNWTVNAGTPLFKSGPNNNNWADRSCSSAPTAGQNMIISTDGINITWGTYTEQNYTVYFKNNFNWSDVYIHLYANSVSFDGSKGVGGNKAAVNEKMTKIGSGPYFKYEFSSVYKFSNVCFTRDKQDNYDDFYGNACSWSTGLDFDNNHVLWIPSTEQNPTNNVNNCPYFNTGEWSVYPPLVPSVSFVNVPSEVYKGQTVTFAATSENIANPIYTYLVDGVSATSPYKFDDPGSHTVTVEARSNGVGAATTADMTVNCKQYSLMTNDHLAKGSKVADCTTTDGVHFVAKWNCSAAGNYYFYVTTDIAPDANTNCDYLCSGQTLTNGSEKNAYLYGTSSYGHSYALNATVTGEYTFTLTLGSENKFRCDFPAAAPEPDAFVAGSITDIFGSPAWKPDQEDNKMTWDEGSSLFTKSFTVDKAYKSVGLKVVYGGEWYGDNGDNVKFSLSGAGTFTVKFNKTSHAVTVEGDIVGDEQFDFNYITVAGNGTEGNSWVNGEDWNAAAEANRMTEVATGIYEISYSEVKGVESTFQFAFDGGWDYQFGGTFSEFGTATTAVFSNSNITFTPTEGADITIRLDLSAFNFATKEGATFTVSQLEPVPAVKIKGTVVNGSWEEDPLDLEVASDRKSASITIAIPQPGDYEFKMILGDDEWRSNGYTYHRDFIAAAGIDNNDDANMKLEAEVAGNYTFKWIYATDSIHIDFPECDYYIKNNWHGCDWKWKGLIPGANGTYRIENVVYGGNGVNFNTVNSDEDATWVGYADIKYADSKDVAAYDTVNFVLNPATGVITAESRSKDVAVYTLAGSELALFSQGWAPTHLYKYTDMEKQSDGKYKWTNLDEKATLCKGPIEYKVIKDRAYANGNWPEGDGNNFVLDVLRGGEYEIAIYFDPCSKTSWVDTTLVKEIDVRNLTLKGDDDWTTGHPFTRSEYNDRASVTLSLTASENPYKFKLYENGDYWYGDGQAFTRENPAIRDIVIPVGVEEPANMTLQVDKTGDYLFTYIFETKELVVSYPSVVPETKIAPLSGEFSIGSAATTGRMSNKIRFSRGNLQYNFDEQVWYAAENQYESLGDLNLRFGDDTYKGSVDLFDWSCTSSNFGLLASNVNNDYTGDFKDWGQKFAEDANDWFTLSQPEWNYLLYSRTKDNKSLWSVMGLAVGPDTVNVFALFPDDWTAPSGVTINYGFYDVDDEAQLKENSFSKEKWEAMEEAGAVFLPLAGARAGWWGNKVGIDGETLVNSPMNPLANNSYCWVDGGEWYGYYWTSTIENSVNVKTAVMPAWHNNKMTAPQYWGRARRYGQSVRLVTRVPREPDYVRGGEEHPEELPAGQYGTICLPNGGELDGATIYELAYYDASASKIFLDEVLNGTMVAGTPYIFFPEGDEPKIEVYYTDAENAEARQNVNGLYGSYTKELLTPNEGNYILYNNQYWLVNSEAYVGANRAYLRVADMTTTPTPPQQGRRRVAMGVNGKQTPTGVDEIQGENVRSAKVLINGRLYILRGEKMYDATGRLLK